jgi:integrase
MWSKWYVVNSDDKVAVRRYMKIGGKTKWERMPAEKYRDLSPDEILSFINRENVTKELKVRESLERYNFDHSFVKTHLKEAFEQYLLNRASDLNHVATIMTYLNQYTLDYFINQRKLPHPNLWVKAEESWGSFLLKQQLSPSTLKTIVQVANRFVKFLSRKYPGEVHPSVLEPFSRKKLQDLAARMPNVKRVKLITDEHYHKMLKECRPELIPFIKLGYLFGLRCAEIGGLEEESVLKECLAVTRQLVSVSPRRTYGPLKSKQVRDVPYWYSSPGEAYELIKAIPVIHPNTVSDYFAADMKRLKLPYQFHDLRRTFITRALKKEHWRDVQLAAGHYDIKTTIQYAQDDRQFNREVWRPM